MRALTGPLDSLSGISETKAELHKRKAVSVTGCVDSQKWNMAFALADGFSNKVIVTYSDVRVKEIYEDYRFYDRNVTVYGIIKTGRVI